MRVKLPYLSILESCSGAALFDSGAPRSSQTEASASLFLGLTGASGTAVSGSSTLAAPAVSITMMLCWLNLLMMFWWTIF